MDSHNIGIRYNRSMRPGHHRHIVLLEETHIGFSPLGAFFDCQHVESSRLAGLPNHPSDSWEKNVVKEAIEALLLVGLSSSQQVGFGYVYGGQWIPTNNPFSVT